MPSRLALPTIAGSLQPFVAQDTQFGIPTGAQLTGLFLALQTAPSGGSCVVEVRTAAGGGGAAVTVTFTAGSRFGTWTGTLDVSALASLYLRVVSANDATDLSGTIELGGGDYLTSLERIKRWYGKGLASASLSASEMDSLLADLIASASQRIKTHLGRELVRKTYTGEFHDGTGRLDHLALRQYPVASITQVLIDGNVLDPSEYAVTSEEAGAGLLRRVNGCWPAGRRNIRVDYVAGYDPVPQDIQDAATLQVGWDMLRAPAMGGKIGVRQTVLAEGGDQILMVDAWAPETLSRLAPYREVRL